MGEERDVVFGGVAESATDPVALRVGVYGVLVLAWYIN